MMLKAPYLLGFRHKKKTSEDVFRWLFGGAGGDLNPRPPALRYRFYMLSQLY